MEAATRTQAHDVLFLIHSQLGCAAPTTRRGGGELQCIQSLSLAVVGVQVVQCCHKYTSGHTCTVCVGISSQDLAVV